MIAILRFLGTNCEFDIEYACRLLNIECAIIWHKEETLPLNTSLVIIPGGFSYGDYLRSGAIAKLSPIMKAVKEYAYNGGFVFGICNGFQILCEAQMLPGALIRNKNILFHSKMAELKVISNNNKLLKNYYINQKINIPIAHADGNYYINKDELESLKENNQILLKYTTDINGSMDKIAGICNKDKNIFGMMPHPERAIEDMLVSKDGLAMIKSICENNSINIKYS
ncbi:phosphoribosylformylglycinamidine synthase subunit PurQ [Helicobacter sp. MIT 14-3879]|uniref:phosphoribosylformylglycinamidine synthase subunit PurQ n=1 Tax=Helicobacter sp. MIT 14-3879 TaxID=2040649 RepID=UPI000E1F061B|nr:phosphoribosylformylglycinamidine synthase subunit PurQ [Helicobacter sp. MIT 14-3879]RDU62092.1 phosphoribosylformylglycinamidine synthase I [Helicobacter sp. MIT 14-3879]